MFSKGSFFRVVKSWDCVAKILGLPKLKAFADDKLNVTQNVKVIFHGIENIVGKEENAGHQHFLLFPQCFHTAFSSSASKVFIVC